MGKSIEGSTGGPWTDADFYTAILQPMLVDGSPFMRWVDKWKSSPNLHLIQFIFSASKPWRLRIGACVSQNASSSYYRVLDMSVDPPVIGLDDDGDLTTLVIGRGPVDTAPAPVPQVATVTPESRPQAAIITQIAPQEVSTILTRLQTAGGNVAAALDRLKQAAAKAAAQAGVDRTKGALEQLVQLGTAASQGRH